jgi:hypothetical protein
MAVKLAVTASEESLSISNGKFLAGTVEIVRAALSAGAKTAAFCAA